MKLNSPKLNDEIVDLYYDRETIATGVIVIFITERYVMFYYPDKPHDTHTYYGCKITIQQRLF
jgi:hypothetical protein